MAELKFKSVYLEIVLEPTGSPVSRYVWMIAFNIFLFLSSNSVSTKISSFLLYSPVSTRFSGVLTIYALKIARCLLFVNTFSWFFYEEIVKKV